MEIKRIKKKRCPVCSREFLTLKHKRKPKGMRNTIILRQPNAYTCSKFCSKTYQRVKEDLERRGFIVKKKKEDKNVTE